MPPPQLGKAPSLYARTEQGTSRIDVTTDQRNTIIVACVYAVVILILVSAVSGRG